MGDWVMGWSLVPCACTRPKAQGTDALVLSLSSTLARKPRADVAWECRVRISFHKISESLQGCALCSARGLPVSLPSSEASTHH